MNIRQKCQCFLGGLVICFILICFLTFHLWPAFHCTRLEGIGPLRETLWFTPEGTECGHAWPESFTGEDGAWHAYHSFGIERGSSFVDKKSAYQNVEFWYHIDDRHVGGFE